MQASTLSDFLRARTLTGRKTRKQTDKAAHSDSKRRRRPIGSIDFLSCLRRSDAIGCSGSTSINRFSQRKMRNRALPCHRPLLLALLISMVCLSSAWAVAPQEKLVHSNWRFRAINPDVAVQFKEWHPATVPGVVQTDLLANKLI